MTKLTNLFFILLVCGCSKSTSDDTCGSSITINRSYSETLRLFRDYSLVPEVHPTDPRIDKLRRRKHMAEAILYTYSGWWDYTRFEIHIYPLSTNQTKLCGQSMPDSAMFPGHSTFNKSEISKDRLQYLLSFIEYEDVYGDRELNMKFISSIHEMKDMPTQEKYDNVVDFINKGADVNGLNLYEWGGNTVLDEACRLNDAITVSQLLELGADPNLRFRISKYPPLSRTALHTAVKYSSIEILDSLLSHGANPLSTNEFGETAMEMCTDLDKLKLLQKFANQGMDLTR